MRDPSPPDPDRPARAGADEIAADLERLRRTASPRRPFRQRLRREVRQAEVATLAFLVVAAGFLALHLAQRGNEVSLTERAAATSPTTPPPTNHVAPGAPATTPPSESTERDTASGPGPTVDASQPGAGRTEGEPVEPLEEPPGPQRAPDREPEDNSETSPTTTIPTIPEPTTTTSTSTTSTTTTTSTSTPTIDPPPPPPP